MTEQQSTSIANDCVMEQEQKVVGGDWGSTTIPDSTEVDLNTDTLSDSITNVAKEIREYFNRVQHTIPANDNDSSSLYSVCMGFSP